MAAIAVACSSSSTDQAKLAELSAGCIVNSDCDSPLVCAFKTCHDKCETSRDCPDNELCVASDKPYHVCQLPSEATCVTNADCAGNEICGPDSHCRDQCKVDRDCLQNQMCQSGVCVDVDMPIDASLIDGSPAGTSCTYNHDCSPPLVCQNGVCEVECTVDRDCAVGYACVQSRCVPVGPTTVDASGGGGDGGVPLGGGCHGTSDCSPPLVCKNGACEPQCTVSIDCPGGDVCVGQVCVPSVPPGSGEGGVPAFDGSIPDGAPNGYGGPCRTNDDCQNTLICVSGACIYQCNNNFDCDTAHGFCCAPWHACVSGLACFSGGDASVALCQGASCPLVATGQTRPTAITYDTHYVYWTDDAPNGAVRACPVGNNCGASSIDVAAGQDTPTALALSPGKVAWVTYATGRFWLAGQPGIDGGLAPQTPNASGSTHPNSVIASGALYASASDGQVHVYNTIGGDVATIAYSAPTSLTLNADGDTLYWVSNGAQIVTDSLSTGSLVPLYSDTNIVAVVSDDNTIYWATTGPNAHIASAPRVMLPDGGSSVTVLAPATGPMQIAQDPQYVYWTDFSDGAVRRVAKTGGAVLTLASGLSLPWGIAVSGTAVYWTNSGDGTVMSLAK
jgi:hypothetical protein